MDYVYLKKNIYFVKNNYKAVMMWNMLIIIIIIVKLYTFFKQTNQTVWY